MKLLIKENVIWFSLSNSHFHILFFHKIIEAWPIKGVLDVDKTTYQRKKKQKKKMEAKPKIRYNGRFKALWMKVSLQEDKVN